MNSENIKQVINKIPTADQIANTEMSFEMTAGIIVIFIILSIIMPVIIFAIMGEKMGA